MGIRPRGAGPGLPKDIACASLMGTCLEGGHHCVCGSTRQGQGQEQRPGAFL